MNYWVAKGKPGPRNDWDKTLWAGNVRKWRTLKPTGPLAVGDRVFLWESAPRLQIIGLAEVKAVRKKPDSRETWFTLEYLTDRLQVTLGISELRTYKNLQDASFLKRMIIRTLYPLTKAESSALLKVVLSKNAYLGKIWATSANESSQETERNSNRNLAVPPDLELISSGVEGRKVLVTHFRRERNRKLIEHKKRTVLATGKILDCEVCGFNFSFEYGDRGNMYCEVHHRKPISTTTGEIRTTLKDLAIVCSNCHRMLHVYPWTSVEKLRKSLKKVH